MQKKLTTTLFILSLLLISGTLIVKHFNEQNLKASIPYLMKGEEVSYFNVTDVNAARYSSDNLKEGPALLFIFKRPCSHCNGNVILWKRMAIILKKENIPLYGIVLDGDSEMFNLKEKARPEFTICAPDDVKEFVTRFRIRLNLGQTILVNRGKVVSQHLGDLTAKEFNRFILEARNLRKLQTGA